MSVENISIRVYSGTGDIDGSLSPVISIYNNDTLTQEISSASMAYSASRGKYEYIFTGFIETNYYTCDVFFWNHALTKYSSFTIWWKSDGWLTVDQAQQLSDTAKIGNLIIKLDDDVSIIQ